MRWTAGIRRWVMLALGLCVFSFARAEEKTALPKDGAAIMTEWHLRHFYEPFSVVTKDSQKLTEADRQAMREMVVAYARYDGNRDLLNPRLFDAYHKLRDRMDANEPLFVFLHFWRFDVFPGRYKSCMEEYGKIIKTLQERKEIYSPATARCVAQVWMESYDMVTGGCGRQSLPELDQLALDLQMEAIESGAYREGEEFVLLEHLISDPLRRGEGNYRWFEANWKEVVPRLAASEKVHPAVLATVEGYAALLQRDYAGAEKRLTEAWELRPDLPHAAALMIKVCDEGGLAKRRAKLWFERGRKAQPNFEQLYGRYSYFMSQRLTRPRDVPELLAMAREFGTLPGKMAVYQKYVVFRVWEGFAKKNPPTAEMREGLREALQTELCRLDAVKERGKTYDWRISMAHLVLMSWLLEDYAEGKKFAEELGKDAFDGWDEVWFDRLDVPRDRAFAECCLFGDPAADASAYREAMALYDAGQFALLLPLLPALKETHSKVPRMEKWLLTVEKNARSNR